MTNDESHPAEAAPEGRDRRRFLKKASRVAMAAGLAGGYGGFVAVAGRYLYPARTGEVMWQFVTELDGIDPGEAIRYRGPAGETIMPARSADSARSSSDGCLPK